MHGEKLRLEDVPGAGEAVLRDAVNAVRRCAVDRFLLVTERGDDAPIAALVLAVDDAGKRRALLVMSQSAYAWPTTEFQQLENAPLPFVIGTLAEVLASPLAARRAEGCIAMVLTEMRRACT